MYISRIMFKQKGLENLYMRDADTRYALHQLVWDLFPKNKGASRDFIYRYEEEPHLQLVTVSERKPEPSVEEFDIVTKDFDPALSVGDRLQIRGQVNPVTRVTGKDGKRRKVDVVQHTRIEMQQQGIDPHYMPSRSDLVQQEGLKWLQHQGTIYGFTVEKGVFDNYQQYRFRKGKRKICLASSDLQAVITITDVAKTKKALTKGIGSGKAFGFGLIQAKRA